MRSRLVALLVATLAVAGAPPARASLDAGDAAWETRAEVVRGELADPARVREALEHYRAALAGDPTSVEARWKLLRASHYAIDFTTLPEAAKDAILEEAVTLARDAVDRVAAAGGAATDRAHLLFWASIAWGVRAQRVGLLTIVREGVARRMHHLAAESLELDPRVEDGGALRLLARLHADLPYVPFVSGWVDRDEAVPYAERAFALAPGHPGNRVVLALTLLDRAPARTEEARRLLESVVTAEPRAEFRVEDLAIRKQARKRLAELDANPE